VGRSIPGDSMSPSPLCRQGESGIKLDPPPDVRAGAGDSNAPCPDIAILTASSLSAQMTGRTAKNAGVPGAEPHPTRIRQHTPLTQSAGCRHTETEFGTHFVCHTNLTVFAKMSPDLITQLEDQVHIS